MERQVRSVYLSDQDSVFAQPEAHDLLLILHACATPESDTRVRSALACAVLDLAYAELDTLNQDEVRWEETVEQFHGYRQQWQTQGVLPMLRSLLMDFHVPARLSQSLDGERALTNLLHLAELLQQVQSWQALEELILFSCDSVLPDRFLKGRLPSLAKPPQ